MSYKSVVNKVEYLGFLDALRGWAIIGVILVHSSNGLKTFGLTEFTHPFAYSGQRGVPLFFVVSAFTIFYNLYKYSNFLSINNIKSFYLRRFFRIYPLFGLFLLIGVITKLIEFNEFNIVNIILTSTFMDVWDFGNFQHYVPGGWSISTEMYFYLLAPLFFKYIRNFKTAFVVFWVVQITCGYLGKYLGTNYGNAYMYKFYSVFTQYFVFFMGIFAYFIWSKYLLVFEKISKTYINILLYLSFLTLLIFAHLGMHIISYVCFFGVFILIASQSTSLLISGSVIQFIGKISYSCYFWHFVVINLLNKLMPNSFWYLSVVILFILTFIISYFSYRFIEKPGIAFGRRFITRHIK